MRVGSCLTLFLLLLVFVSLFIFFRIVLPPPGSRQNPYYGHLGGGGGQIFISLFLSFPNFMAFWGGLSPSFPKEFGRAGKDASRIEVQAFSNVRGFPLDF